MAINALFLNCTLKYSPETSNTDALIQKIVEVYEDLGVTSSVERVTDYDIKFGVSADEGDGDEWLQLYKKIAQCDILVIATPIWMGVRSSVAQLVIERLDSTYGLADEETGQYPLYNKVGAVVITGNEDGAHAAAETILFNLSHFGATIPPNADCYWVGEAGPGPSYIEAGGDKHLYTNRTARMLAHNTTDMAKKLKKHPITTNLKEIDAEAKKVSRA